MSLRNAGDEILRSLERAVEESPDDAVAKLRLAQELRRRGDPRQRWLDVVSEEREALDALVPWTGAVDAEQTRIVADAVEALRSADPRIRRSARLDWGDLLRYAGRVIGAEKANALVANHIRRIHMVLSAAQDRLAQATQHVRLLATPRMLRPGPVRPWRTHMGYTFRSTGSGAIRYAEELAQRELDMLRRLTIAGHVESLAASGEHRHWYGFDRDTSGYIAGYVVHAGVLHEADLRLLTELYAIESEAFTNDMVRRHGPMGPSHNPEAARWLGDRMGLAEDRHERELVDIGAGRRCQVCGVRIHRGESYTIGRGGEIVEVYCEGHATVEARERARRSPTPRTVRMRRLGGRS